MRQVVAVVVGVILAFVALGGAAFMGGVIGFVAGTAAGFDFEIPSGGPERTISGTGTDKIALIRIVGPITRERAEAGALFGNVASSRSIVELLNRAQEDPLVRAVIVELNTPGGSVVASDEVYRKLRAVRAAGKPVVALMTEVAASGGYYIAAAADHIVADASTITGSIGVIVVLANWEELNRKIGIRTVVFKSGTFKDLGNPDRRITRAESAIFQKLVDETHARFVTVVAQGRRMDHAQVRRLADGRIYTGAQALRLRLVDGLGQLPDAVRVAKARAKVSEARVVEFGPGGFLESLLGFAGGVLPPWLRAPAGRGSAPFSLQYLMVP